MKRLKCRQTIKLRSEDFMKQTKHKKEPKNSSKPEKITAEEALKRMKIFSERKEKMIAFIIKSEN